MGLFDRTVNKAAISPPPAKAAAAGAANYTSRNNGGTGMIGQYYSYVEGDARNRAMSVPTISRARDLMASVIGCMNLKMYTEMWNGSEMEKMPLAPRTWLRRIDPTVPNNFLLSWTLDDLFFFGRAFWYITSRTADGYPASFTRLPAAMVQTLDQSGPVWFAPSKQIVFQGGELNPDDVVQFLSPIQGIIYMSEQSVSTALKLEAARYRNASSAIPAGVLRQNGGEPMSAQELADLAAAFNSARATNQTACTKRVCNVHRDVDQPRQNVADRQRRISGNGNGSTMQHTALPCRRVGRVVLLPVVSRSTHGLVDIWRARLRRLHRWHTKPKQHFA
jgi:hypothetical protein